MIIWSILLYNWIFSTALGAVVFGFLDIWGNCFEQEVQDGEM